MRAKRPDGTFITCDHVVEIDNATLYMRWVKYFPATFESPAEGGYFEIVDWDGTVNDDDLPDLEVEANAKIDDDSDYYLDHISG